ncbi:putative integral membrane protein [Aspergillus steynii IBT 23096]|uniref:Putative integral membrane protein n=1 Tax=Aspergillus steynii IBT 23096 TaxID=1392250 RepID=A0A2I2GRF2_9EURO|nr:putative integral membrane protein [Aspergillus steynii IBT 23096]PLB55470.1 putative integral membrane protein [Aspergillus steynii IBT 23096]
MAIGVPRGRQALTTSAVFTCLATLLVVIRIYTRAFLVKQMGADDWTILVSLAFSWAFFGVFVGETAYLMGEHYANIPAQIFIKQMICFWASVPLYQASLLTTKASILLQYKRVFSTPRMRVACYYLIGFLVIYGAWTIMSAWLNCMPVARFWDDSIDGYCLNKKALWFSNSAIHIFTDILIMVYPMPVLKSLQLPRRQKIALMGVFLLGAFVLITSILRLKSLLVISNTTDPTYDNVGAATWSAIECNVAIICACLPGIRAFISRLIPRILSTRSGSRSAKATTNRNARSRSRNTILTGFQTSTSVVANAPDYRLQNLDSRGRSPGHDDRDSQIDSRERIKVTTVLAQEFVDSGSGSTPDEDSSVRGLVDK